MEQEVMVATLLAHQDKEIPVVMAEQHLTSLAAVAVEPVRLVVMDQVVTVAQVVVDIPG